MRGGSIAGGGVKYNKCKRLAVLQRGEFILGTQLFAALGVRDTVSVTLSVCDAVYCGAQSRCTGLKVVPSCF